MDNKPKHNPQFRYRKSIRLKGYDYSQEGLYFITICCHQRACLFGEIVETSLKGEQKTNAQMILNDAGKMIETEWLKLFERFTNISLHDYVVMPNHFHAILQISGTSFMNLAQPQDVASAKPKTIGDMMDAFKSITTVNYIRGVKNGQWKPFNGKIWQPNYYEHIIRNELAYNNISDTSLTIPQNGPRINFTENKYLEKQDTISPKYRPEKLFQELSQQKHNLISI